MAKANGAACADSLIGSRRRNTNCTFASFFRSIEAMHCVPIAKADASVGNRTLPEVSALSIKDAAAFFDALELSPEQAAIADRVLSEVRRRLRFLVEVGLDYLTLDRLASTLSGGEAQRIQLATNLGSSLVGALYVLDEPSIGLHPRDN